jgi:hypothetical protein
MMWNANGAATAYIYVQDRSGRCGMHVPLQAGQGGQFKFVTGRKYRVTMRVKVNTPNQANGQVQIWIDGNQVLNRSNFRLRGSVGASSGRLGKMFYHSFFGGNTKAWAPARDSYIEYGPMHVTRCKPNFGQAPGTCG